jgi:hypothetical protein
MAWFQNGLNSSPGTPIQIVILSGEKKKALYD